MMLEGSTIKILREINELCIWLPAINLMKIYNAESFANSEFMGDLRATYMAPTINLMKI
jgi:hypothetical protein